MNYSKRTDPSKSLLEGKPHTNSWDTDLESQWKTFFQSIREEDPDSIQRSAVAEHQSYQVRGRRQ